MTAMMTELVNAFQKLIALEPTTSANWVNRLMSGRSCGSALLEISSGVEEPRMSVKYSGKTETSSTSPRTV
ncbi:hypothetical protein D3C74_410040 [compost metagenome]